jgi:hypothetical protein
MAAAFREQLANVIEESVTVEALKRDAEATTMWHEVYPLLTAERGGLVGQLSARAAPHVLRLSLLYALLDQASAIGIDHLLAALAVWDYVERSILAIFGSASADPALAKVAQLLEDAPQGLTRTELMNALQRHVPANRLTDHLRQLVQHRLARTETTPTRGRPAERWFACEPSQALTATLECAYATLGRSIPVPRSVFTPVQRWPSA